MDQVNGLGHRTVTAADHVRDQPGPPCLVARAEPGPVVTVVVLVEAEVVAPPGVVLQPVYPAVAGPAPVGTPREQGDEPRPQVLGDLGERELAPRPGRVLDREVVAEEVV